MLFFQFTIKLRVRNGVDRIRKCNYSKYWKQVATSFVVIILNQFKGVIVSCGIFDNKKVVWKCEIE